MVAHINLNYIAYKLTPEVTSWKVLKTLLSHLKCHVRNICTNFKQKLRKESLQKNVFFPKMFPEHGIAFGRLDYKSYYITGKSMSLLLEGAILLLVILALQLCKLIICYFWSIVFVKL